MQQKNVFSSSCIGQSSAFINKESAHSDMILAFVHPRGYQHANGEISGFARSKKRVPSSNAMLMISSFVIGYQQHARVSIQIAFSQKRFSA
jgi:hypothetical protein